MKENSAQDIKFKELGLYVAFKSWTGLRWIKVSNNSAMLIDIDEEYPFEPDEIVFSILEKENR